MFFRKYSPASDYEAPDTKALTAGKHAHHCLLEPDAFQQLVVAPEFSGTGMKAAKQAWLAGLPAGAITITDEQKKVVERICDSVLSDPEARALLRDLPGQNEVCAYAQRDDGIWLHGRMDRMVTGPAVIEFKTTSGAVDWDAFVWDVYEYDYHTALATYIEIAQILEKRPIQEAAWIVAQSCEPHSVRVHYPAEENMLDIGRFDMVRAIERFKDLTRLDPEMKNRQVWFNGREPKEDGPAAFPYHILIRRPEWQHFITGVK